MNKNVVLVIVSLIVGNVIGYTLSPSKTQGRLSACNDMTSAMNAGFPGLDLTCGVSKGEVYVTSPLLGNQKVSLDGTKTIE